MGISLRPVLPVLTTGLICVFVLGVHEYSIRIAGYAYADPAITKAAVVVAGVLCLLTCRRLISLGMSRVQPQPS
jgi:hypothetical protein